MVSEARRKSIDNWQRANMVRRTIKYKAELDGQIKARAVDLGKPVNKYILDLIRVDIESAEQ